MANANRTIANMNRKMQFVDYETFYSEEEAQAFAEKYKADNEGSITKISHSKRFGNYKVNIYTK